MPNQTVDRRLVIAAIGGWAGCSFAAGAARADDCPLQIDVAYHRWSQLQDWAEALKPQIASWWPMITRALGADVCHAGKPVHLAFVEITPPSVAAAAVGDTVYINAPYVLANRDNPDMHRMIAHELAHVAQGYPAGAMPKWLTEGIADYVRYYVLFPDDPGRFFDPRSEDWREGYAPTAGLIDHIEFSFPGALAKTNAVMRAGGDGEAALSAVAGAKLGKVWAAYLATRPPAASTEKRQAYRDSLRPAS